MHSCLCIIELLPGSEARTNQFCIVCIIHLHSCCVWVTWGLYPRWVYAWGPLEVVTSFMVFTMWFPGDRFDLVYKKESWLKIVMKNWEKEKAQRVKCLLRRPDALSLIFTVHFRGWMQLLMHVIPALLQGDRRQRQENWPEEQACRQSSQIMQGSKRNNRRHPALKHDWRKTPKSCPLIFVCLMWHVCAPHPHSYPYTPS